MKLTAEEKQAIAALKKLAKTWPKSLWLFSGSGTLCIMKKVGRRRKMNDQGRVDQDCIAASIAIENDGGDW